MMAPPAVPVPMLRLRCTRHAQQHAQTQSPQHNSLHNRSPFFSGLPRPGSTPKNAQTPLHAASHPQKSPTPAPDLRVSRKISETAQRLPKAAHTNASVQSISISRSSPSTFSSSTSTSPLSGGNASPVRVSNAHECHGQTTASPSSHPCPSGPPRCGQTLFNAHNRPSTFARHTGTPFTSASVTSPGFGASLTAHNRTHSLTSLSVRGVFVPEPAHEMLNSVHKTHARSTQTQRLRSQRSQMRRLRADRTPRRHQQLQNWLIRAGCSKPSASSSLSRYSCPAPLCACSTTRASGRSCCIHPAPSPSRPHPSA